MWCMFFVLGLGGCDKAVVERLREQRDKEALTVAVDTYWAALRWSDVASATWFHPSLDGKVAVTKMLTEPVIHISDQHVVTVTVGPASADPIALVQRAGLAIVRVESVDDALGKVTTELVEQRWQKTGHGWQVDEEASPLHDDHPW